MVMPIPAWRENDIISTRRSASSTDTSLPASIKRGLISENLQTAAVVLTILVGTGSLRQEVVESG